MDIYKFWRDYKRNKAKFLILTAEEFSQVSQFFLLFYLVL